MPVEEIRAILVIVACLALGFFLKASGDEAIMDEFSQLSPDPESGGATGFAILLLAYLSLGGLIFVVIAGAPGLASVLRLPRLPVRVDGPTRPTTQPVASPIVASATNWQPAAVVAPDGAWLRESADGAGRIVLAQGAVIEVDVDSRSEVDGILWYRVRRRGPGGGWEAGWMAFRAPDGSQLIDYVDRR